MKSPIYWHPAIFHGAMRIAYGRNYAARYKELAAIIPANAHVLELCCGDCHLFRRNLAGHCSAYTGCDINMPFLSYARRRGVRTVQLDILHDPLPAADVVLMHGSLYQFIPHHKELVERMLGAASDCVIIAEPVVNLSDCANPVVAGLARIFNNPGTGIIKQRFSKASFEEFVCRNFSGRIVREMIIAGGREKVFVLNARTR